MKAVDVRVNGSVQGVFYRSAAQAEARRLGLSGWAMNMSDGTVGLHLQGSDEQIRAMLAWCEVGSPGAQVGWLDVQDGVLDESMQGFTVR